MMKIKKILLIIIALLFVIPAISQENNTNSNLNGWYFLVGTGFSVSIYESDASLTTRSNAGGMHLSTSIGYFSNNSYSIEIGSVTSLNEFDKIYMKGADSVTNSVEMTAWNSIFFWSIRARFPRIKPTNNISPFIKIFYGYGSSVGFLHNPPEENKALGDVRMHQEGPLFGISFSNIFNTLNSQQVWFIELTFLRQIFWERFAIDNSGVVATIIKSEPTNNNDTMMQLHISIGTNIF